jgi:hypothetical protein
MDDISWTDLNPAEQHAIAALGAGMPVGLCDAAAVRRLKRVGLLSGSHLTRKAGRLRKAAILQNLTNIQPLSHRLKSVQYARWAIQQLREVRSQDHDTKCRFLARNRHARAVATCPLLRDERTSIIRYLRSHFDPVRTSPVKR